MTIKRRFDRVSFFCDVSVTGLPDGPTFPGRTIDICLGGVALATQGTLEPNQLVSLRFSLGVRAALKAEDRVVGRVVRLTAESDANILAVEFLEPLSESDNAGLLRRVLVTA